MSDYDFDDYDQFGRTAGPPQEPILAQLAPEPPIHAVPRRSLRRRVRLPLLLFVGTCLSTLLVGSLDADPSTSWTDRIVQGLTYAVPLMTILVCHEAGHFLQARRHGVYASFPYFVPMPFSVIGTFGAVIAMEPRMGNRRALFDIGITGPLAGLVPTLIFCAVGLHLSQPVDVAQVGGGQFIEVPLLFRLIQEWMGATPGPREVLPLHPVAFAGWVGLLITALNLLPIGQLDGGHILYGLLRTKAHAVATVFLLAGAVAIFRYGLWGWTLMLMLLLLMGPAHPPTANDNVPLGPVRTILGWLTLAFIPLGFTPDPFGIAN